MLLGGLTRQSQLVNFFPLLCARFEGIEIGTVPCLRHSIILRHSTQRSRAGLMNSAAATVSPCLQTLTTLEFSCLRAIAAKKPTGRLLGACSGRRPMGYRFSLLTLLFSGVFINSNPATWKSFGLAKKFCEFLGTPCLQASSTHFTRGYPAGGRPLTL